MRLRFQELISHLERCEGLAPVYLLSGQEPLQLRDAALAVRHACLGAGVDERIVLDQDGTLDWAELGAARANLSLFSASRLLELRVTAARLGQSGSAAVREYCAAHPAADRLLILAPALEHKELRSAWLKAVERVGVVVQVWPLTGGALNAWVEGRLVKAGFAPDRGVASFVAERAEGNMLAADQEVEKLALLHPPGPLDEASVREAIGDSARFDPFGLTAAAVAGDRRRVHRILAVLEADGTPRALVLWALAREVRMLAAVAFARRQGADLAPVFARHQVWQSRRAGAMGALKRLSLLALHGLLRQCADADACVKGVAAGDAWAKIAAIADGLAGCPGTDAKSF